MYVVSLKFSIFNIQYSVKKFCREKGPIEHESMATRSHSISFWTDKNFRFSVSLNPYFPFTTVRYTPPPIESTFSNMVPHLSYGIFLLFKRSKKPKQQILNPVLMNKLSYSEAIASPSQRLNWSSGEPSLESWLADYFLMTCFWKEMKRRRRTIFRYWSSTCLVRFDAEKYFTFLKPVSNPKYGWSDLPSGHFLTFSVKFSTNRTFCLTC